MRGTPGLSYAQRESPLLNLAIMPKTAPAPIPSAPLELLEGLAREHLGIETLATRNRDCLDFHDVGVGCLKSALEAAFAAGVRAQRDAGALDETQARAHLKKVALERGVTVQPASDMVAALVAASRGELR